MILGIIPLIGFAYLLVWFYRYIYRLFFVKPVNLRERYGENSWAVITGGSDGIGLGVARRLAVEGFNIVLIARTQEKLEKAKAELLVLNPLIDVIILVKDFTGAGKAEFFDDISERLRELEVSILVNNVGVMPVKEVFEQSLKEMKDTIVVNACSQVGMSKMLLPRFIERGKRCAQIDVSSVGSFFPVPAFPVYSATKSINEYISRGLSAYVKNVDFLTVHPGMVSTNMCQKEVGRGQFFFNTQSVHDCANGIVNKLACVDTTYGAFMHDVFVPLSQQLVQLIPRDLLMKVIGLWPTASNLESWKKL